MSIYDDLAALETRVAELETASATTQATLAGMQVQTLASGADLLTLELGEYLIPNATVSATILNKPVTNSHTALVSVVTGGDAGQKTVIFRECSKTDPSYHIRAYYSGAWGEWQKVSLMDSGWIDLPLADGITAYSEGQTPKYRKIGEIVVLCGVFKGVTASNTTIATLPAGFRPSKKHIVAGASVGQGFAKYSIETNGEIVYNRLSIEPVIAENWHSVAFCFTLN